MEIRILEYVAANGTNHYRRWFESLDVQAAVKTEIAVSRIAAGNTSSIKWFGGIGEVRIQHGPGYRVYLAQDGSELIVLFAGGTKQRQQDDIDRARRLLIEYKQRMKTKR